VYRFRWFRSRRWVRNPFQCRRELKGIAGIIARNSRLVINMILKISYFGGGVTPKEREGRERRGYLKFKEAAEREKNNYDLK